MNNQNYHPSFYRVTAQGLHQRFIDCLLTLKEVSAPEAQEIYIADAKDIYSESKAFLSDYSDHLCVQSLSLLQHIVAKDLDSHLAITNANSNNLVSSN